MHINIHSKQFAGFKADPELQTQNNDIVTAYRKTIPAN